MRTRPPGGPGPRLAPARADPAATCQAGAMLRRLREPRTGRPGPGARLLAVVLVGCLIGMEGPVLMPVLHWVLALL